MPSLRAVVFDLDDTLVDYKTAAARERLAVAGLVARHAPGVRLDLFQERFDDYLRTRHAEVDVGSVSVSRFRADRLRHALEPWGRVPDGLDRAVAACADRTAQAVTLVEGVPALLAVLRRQGLRLGVATNGPTTIQRAKCLRLDVESLTDAVVTSQDAGCVKPAPGAFHHLLDRLGVSADEAVVVGDSWHNDVLGGLAAGLAAAVHVHPRPSPEPPPAGLLGSVQRVTEGLLTLLDTAGVVYAAR
jgi:HAD superfamily hydrolase (TIGR01509 family)